MPNTTSEKLNFERKLQSNVKIQPPSGGKEHMRACGAKFAY